MFPGAVARRLGTARNPGPTGLGAVAAVEIDSSAIFMDLSRYGRSMDAELPAAPEFDSSEGVSALADGGPCGSFSTRFKCVPD
jgi:hypothetical protein